MISQVMTSSRVYIYVDGAQDTKRMLLVCFLC